MYAYIRIDWRSTCIALSTIWTPNGDLWNCAFPMKIINFSEFCSITGEVKKKNKDKIVIESNRREIIRGNFQYSCSFVGFQSVFYIYDKLSKLNFTKYTNKFIFLWLFPNQNDSAPSIDLAYFELLACEWYRIISIHRYQ